MNNMSTIKMNAPSSVRSKDVYFQINSFPTAKITDNFQDKYFESRKPRSRTVLMGLPEEGKNDDFGTTKRNYIIGGNWKSRGEWDFVDDYPEEVLDK